ncbi:UDP-4-amino-4,6-dideoxy-N-acetyl-beta-L-altrosamine N-acetyltransferase [Kurthia gibsonii]|uniref:UDP-4-amino-4, 6-dideoxy-N-acetyl-beta-L-altrosamine N-acetyltransferase n=1 Tax=Kurthia gibsonii TaxID=33946 RepID=A0ABU9LN82_9BACL
MLDINKSRLEDLSESTKTTVLKWRNQHHIRSMMFNQNKITVREHEQWFENLKNNQNQIVKVFYYDEIPMGVVTFTKIKNTLLYEWGFYIGNIEAPKGLGTLLGVCALDYYFTSMNKHKLVGEVLAYNQKSIAFHKKLGFQQEGILRQHYSVNEKLHDVHLFGILKEEWFEIRPYFNK